MEYGLTDEQRALDDAVAGVLAAHAHPRTPYDEPEAPAVDVALWDRLRDLGVLGLAVPEEHDGAGAGPVELALVCERLGHAVAPVPVLGQVVAAEAIRLAGDDALAKELLPELASGARRAGIVPAGPGVDPAPDLVSSRDGQTVSGRVPLALDAVGADLLVLPATDGDWYVVEVGPGVTISPQPTLDRTRPAAVVVLEEAPARRLGAPGSGARIGRRAVALLRALEAAEAVGIAAWALEQTRAYAGSREQFGLPIGTFQAVKHRLADMLVAVENARSASYGAAWALAADPASDAAVAVAMAQAVATEAAVQVTADAVQLHGGIGVTWENDLHLRLRRAKTLQLLHGSPSWHREQVAAVLLDG
ncbi:acyl-CoA dehydrogenase [Nocardioides marmoriginsengisoli]|uniref:Acyl-CoA dehydrogenase n=1 Tax=Nocardioides marmoriginsengisoli TaxID=661483 RepID=A0A3N0CFY5_9ACTN|nr:acyl-CoA dehydrogenase family protein [Nocardioides marmoriginsengisoli]RNL62358.1 acyl-CoA dehydrogenase [Nocardioides marmoriginsengisoli]